MIPQNKIIFKTSNSHFYQMSILAKKSIMEATHHWWTSKKLQNSNLTNKKSGKTHWSTTTQHSKNAINFTFHPSIKIWAEFPHFNHRFQNMEVYNLEFNNKFKYSMKGLNSSYRDVLNIVTSLRLDKLIFDLDLDSTPILGRDSANWKTQEIQRFLMILNFFLAFFNK